MNVHRNAFWLDSDWIKQFEAHVAVINAVKVEMNHHMRGFEPDEDLRSALAFFGWKLPSIEPEDFNDVRDPEETRYYVSFERQIEAPNPAANIIVEFKNGAPGSKDRFDLLRDLESIILQLREHVRGINDPSIITPTVLHAMSYIGALNEFIRTDSMELPETAPLGLAQATRSRLAAVDWLSVSEKAAKLVGNIRAIMDALRLFF